MEEIRRLQGDDGRAYRALWLRALHDHPVLFGREYAEVAAISPEEFACALTEAAAIDTDWIWGAFDPELIGMVRLRRYSEPRKQHKAYITRMYTIPERRGQGLGRLLLDTALTTARQLPGLLQVTLAVVADNGPAQALYHACGFETFGVERRAEIIDGQRVDQEEMVYWIVPLDQER
jgi:ribosomal protein S18 acetylase RimI-like enzyme